MEVRKYKELKAANRVTIEPYGDKVIVKTRMYDPFNGQEILNADILVLAEVKRQLAHFDEQFANMSAEKENFDQFVADVQAASAPDVTR